MPAGRLPYSNGMGSIRIPTLATPRLVMRPPSPGDLDDLAALFGDAEATNFVLNGRTMSATQVAHMLEMMLAEARHGSTHPGWVPGIPGWLTIVKPDTQEFVGVGVLRMLAPDLAAAVGAVPDPAVEAGYILAKPFWGQGLATEVAKSLVAYGVGLVGAGHVVAVADVRNAASHRVLEKAGFEQRAEYDFRDMRMNYWTLV